MQLDPSSYSTSSERIPARWPALRLPQRRWVRHTLAAGLLASAALMEAACSVSGMASGQPARAISLPSLSSLPALSGWQGVAGLFGATAQPQAPVITQLPAAQLEPVVAVAEVPVVEAPVEEAPPVAVDAFPYPYAEPTGAPFIPQVERWRGSVRMLIEEARLEGRLNGPAGRVDENLVLAVIEQESGGDPNAMSWAGARGLMQLMPASFAWIMGIRNWGEDLSGVDPNFAFDPHTNLRAGIRFLGAVLEEQNGSVYWALASYNAGGGTVNYWRALGLTSVPEAYWETAAYAPAILGNYNAHRG